MVKLTRAKFFLFFFFFGKVLGNFLFFSPWNQKMKKNIGISIINRKIKIKKIKKDCTNSFFVKDFLFPLQ